MDLFVSLQKDSPIPLYEQLYEGIKDAILSQQLISNTKLPAKRQLADFLSISQTTVELAYGQLLAEGYIRSVPRIGFYVEDISSLPYANTSTIQPPIVAQPNQPILYNFSPGLIDEEAFPFTIWRKYAKDVIDEMNHHLLQPGQRQGEYELRHEIAQYLSHSRGIHCTPEQIVVGSGTEQLLPMILNLIDGPTKLAIENPGYSAFSFTAADTAIVPVDVDQNGIKIHQLVKSDANIAYVTPAHQFPTGAILSAKRRSQLLHWANEAPNRYIIEDDYDSEFRYVGKPIAALRSIDRNNKVIYLSTFTKSLMPSLRVAYFVLPPNLIASYNERLKHYSSTVPRFDQIILASFMRDGYFAKHLNKMRKIYKKKHDLVIQTIEHFYPSVKISGEEAGMHIVIHLKSDISSAELVKIAKSKGINLTSLTAYVHGNTNERTTSFILGFGGLKLNQIEEAIHTLMAVIKQKKMSE